MSIYIHCQAGTAHAQSTLAAAAKGEEEFSCEIMRLKLVNNLVTALHAHSARQFARPLSALLRSNKGLFFIFMQLFGEWTGST